MENKKKRLWFGRDDRPDAVAEDTTPTLRFFFKMLWRKLGKLMSLNLMMLPMVLPITAAVYIFFNGPQMPTLSNPAFSVLMGAQLTGGANASLMSKLMLSLPQINFITYNSYASWLPYVLLIVLGITWGWQNTGITYILRSLVRGDGVFMVSDYFYAIKKNFKQSLLFGFIDAGIIAILIVDFTYTWSSRSNYWSYLMFFAVTALILIYLFMRMYLYLMMITFNISIYKMLKNALIFTALGIKRNLMAALGILICIALWAALAFIGLQYNLGFLIFIPALIMFSLIAFIAAYCAYPIIKKHMIDPVTITTETNS